jgi:isopenicillin-N N-acyltransferase like protein
MGLQHGRKARDAIQHNLNLYFRRFKNETELSREEALKRAEKYLPVIRKADRDYAVAMRGIAEGSSSDLVEITALNVRYELMYSQFAKIGVKPIPRTYGCTAFAAEPQVVKNGHLLMAQNWDWIPQVDSLFLKMRNEDGPDVLCFTEAGVVGGKIGLNSEGLGLMINGLVSNQDDWSRLTKPFHVRCWQVLRSKTLRQASSILTRGERPCSANFVLGQQQGKKNALVDIECAPQTDCRLQPQKGLIAHANHFLDASRLGVVQILDDERLSTLHRFERIQQLLELKTGNGGKLSVGLAKEMLRDHDGKPESVCRHGNPAFPEHERYETVVSVVMDLAERKMWATAGSPCLNEYQSLAL